MIYIGRMATKNPLKTLREKNLDEIGAELVQTASKVARNELNEEWKAFMKQALGRAQEAQNEASQAEKLAGELKEGEEISFSSIKSEKKERRAEGDPDIKYADKILHAETIRVRADNQEIKQRLTEIQIELKKITEKSKELEISFRQVATETIQENIKPGKYHLNFVEWMLSTIQAARVRIESSASWMSALAGKKSKKDYWSLAKSQGTNFTLSGERVVAQQTG